MHRAQAAAEALLLPGLRLCIWFFISNRLMCSDTAPLWEAADRHCQYFLPQKPPTNAASKVLLFSIKLWSLQPPPGEMFPAQLLHFLHPSSPFLWLSFPSALQEKAKECSHSLSFLAAAGLGYSAVYARLLCCQLEVLQYSGVKHPKPGGWHASQEN